MMDNNLNIKTVPTCRTCLEEIINTSFFYLDFTQVEGEPTIGQKLSSCIPELDLSIVPNTVICCKCADTINSLYIFKKECLQSEMQISEYIQVHHSDRVIDLPAVMQFHQLRYKSLTVELKTEAFEETENYKNEESPTSFCENFAFNKTEVNTEIEKTENYKSEESTTSFCSNYVFSETGEVVKTEYLTYLQMVDRQPVLFNTVEDFINADETEANTDTHDDSSIVQDCLLQVIENPDTFTQNLNKTDIYYQCFTCELKAESKLKLIRHLKSHTDNKLCQNKISSKSHKREYSYKQKNKLNSYTLTHAGEKLFKCSVCEYSSNRRESLKRHMLTHTDKKLFKCLVCEYSCNSKQNLKRHLLTHTGEKPFNCAVCEYSCTHKQNLKRHLLTHTGEKPFNCAVCEYSSNNKQTLKSHMLTHTGKKPFMCSVCERSFNHKSHLKNHMLTHTGEKLFKCSVCEYSSYYKNYLKQHMLTHTDKKLFKCAVCEYSCKQKQHLKSHMLTHTGEKPFKCVVCEYSSNHKQSLKSHMLTHTGEEPFKCVVCEYSSNHKRSLKSHMLTHTGKKTI